MVHGRAHHGWDHTRVLLLAVIVLTVPAIFFLFLWARFLEEFAR